MAITCLKFTKKNPWVNVAQNMFKGSNKDSRMTLVNISQVALLLTLKTVQLGPCFYG